MEEKEEEEEEEEDGGGEAPAAVASVDVGGHVVDIVVVVVAAVAVVGGVTGPARAPWSCLEQFCLLLDRLSESAFFPRLYLLLSQRLSLSRLFRSAAVLILCLRSGHSPFNLPKTKRKLANVCRVSCRVVSCAVHVCHAYCSRGEFLFLPHGLIKKRV